MILFLDYDGVLHPNEAYQIPGKGIVLQMDGHDLFEWADLLADTLEGHQDVRIVLSTSWVWTIGFDQSKARLPTRLQERVIGSNWHSSMNKQYWNSLTRYEQIRMYVNRHQVGSNWIAIDDNDFKWPKNKRHHLIHTHELAGLGYTVGALDDLQTKLEMREVD
jgi:hypothetical protein